MVKEGTFREDLYYRLNVIAVHLTPLRERPEDIPLLVQSFIKKLSSQKLPKSPEQEIPVSQEAMRRLMSFPWPGNVRQLENAIERALALIGARTQIETSDLPPDVQAITEVVAPALDLPAEGVDLPSIVAQIEKSLIERALARTGNNKGAAARLLSLKRTTLVEKLKRM